MKAPVFITPWLFFGKWQGFATPFAIFLRQHSVRLERHERKHVEQIWRGWIIGFGIKYAYYLIKYGYWNSPYEIEAREAENG